MGKEIGGKEGRQRRIGGKGDFDNSSHLLLHTHANFPRGLKLRVAKTIRVMNRELELSAYSPTPHKEAGSPESLTRA